MEINWIAFFIGFPIGVAIAVGIVVAYGIWHFHKYRRWPHERR